MLTLSSQATVQVWDTASGNLLARWRAHELRDDTLFYSRFDREGRRLLTATQSGAVRVWDLHQEMRTQDEIAKQLHQKLDDLLRRRDLRSP